MIIAPSLPKSLSLQVSNNINRYKIVSSTTNYDVSDPNMRPANANW
ncbi:MAG: hypothetical protein RLZZ535_2821 [Cyanobacteriota bacterium]|jgi:hypothetical protein